MRKIFIVLAVLVLALGTVFADSSTVRMKSVVEDTRVTISAAHEISPKGLFVLSVTGVLDGNDSTEGERLLMSEYDIAEHDIDIEFSIVQTERVQTLGKINLTATVGSLVLDADSTQTVEASATGTWTTARGLSNYEDAVTINAVTVDNVVSVEIMYIDDTKEVPAQPIGTFVAKWPRSPQLVSNPGLYKANVTLAYTVQ
ncbi:MAG: hypothetical protein IKS77_01480 [Spirochaetales bacterium]|nr:hypothetical protein [Spirochaetales bacterium]